MKLIFDTMKVIFNFFIKLMIATDDSTVLKNEKVQTNGKLEYIY